MDLVWLCLLFPLAGFAINALLGAWLPRRAPGWIATAMILGAFVVAWIVLADLRSLPHAEQHRDVILYQWTLADGFAAPFGAWMAKKVNPDLLLTFVGIILTLTSGFGLYRALI